MKKTLTIILCAVMLLALYIPASAASVTGPEAIETLETLGLVRGTGNGFEPEKTATRAEAAVMLLRLLGEETAAERAGGTSPFSDGGWADRYLAYAYDRGLVRGVSATRYGSGDAVSARDYVTMTLRALGYTEGVDFTWSESLSFSDRIGLTHREYTASGAFLREDLALISYTALTLKLKGLDRKLIESLYLSGAVAGDALKQTRLAGAINAGKTVYSSAEIHEMSASAVFYVDVFETEEDLKKGTPSANGSGFLISPDGVAVMCYHELEDKRYARATLTDGRIIDVTGVLFYDPLSDAAVVRLSKTDTEGKPIRFFPYLDVGDSDGVSAGEAVYTASNPLGLIDSISGGLVSNRSRVVDDPAYPCLQITAPISNGSSGGALLNVYGEVIGILFASYTRGQSLNLAIPINSVRSVDRSAEGVPMAEVCRIETEKKEKAVITADRTRVSLRAGEEKEVLISTDCPGQAGFQYRIGDSDIVKCSWGDYTAKQSVLLKLTGVSAGSTTVELSFSSGYGNEDASLTLNVTVTG